MRRKFIFCVLVAILASSALRADDILEQKKELEQIRDELEKSRESFDSLKKAEEKVLKEITNYEQQAAANKAVLEKLKNRLAGIRREASKSEKNLEQSQLRFETARNRYIGNLNYYYMGIKNVHSDFAREIDREKEAYRKIVYLKALADYDRKDLTRSTEYLTRAESDYDAITSEVQKVDKAHRDKRSEYVILSSNMESRERDLSKLRRKKEREADKLVTLSEAARQMEELISRLEQARADRERADIKTEFDFATGNFAGYKGGLPTPLRGKITSGYGWKQDPITALKSFSPGIEIKGSSNSPVIAVADGVVAYTGALRGYGNFAIIEHEDGYYSMTAGLDMVAVEKGQIVSRGQILGKTQTGRIKFELRQGRSSVDPVEWIRIDSFK